MLRLACMFWALTLSAFSMAARVAVHDVESKATSKLETSAKASSAARVHRAPALFASAFPELHEAAKETCPYLNEGPESPFECNYRADGAGRTCPVLQQARIRAANTFISNQYHEFMEKAKEFPLKPLFDKSGDIIGDEGFEQLVAMHISGLHHPDMKQVEDKIILKGLAASLNVPTTVSYYGAHTSDWNASTFSFKMRELCGSGVDDFVVKATHLAWGDGMQLVRGWSDFCKDPATLDSEITKLVTFIEEQVLGQSARESDGHLRELEHGVTVEELFKSGGNSARPMEAKVQVLWGKVYMMFFVGQDIRGCDSKSGAWTLYGDKTGWDLKGMMGTQGTLDEVNQDFLDKAFDKVVSYAESFATGIGADYTRVDFFLGSDSEGNPVIKMNEAETVSGAKYVYERLGMAMTWRGGYLIPNRFKITPEKWDKYMADAIELRNKYHLDTVV